MSAAGIAVSSKWEGSHQPAGLGQDPVQEGKVWDCLVLSSVALSPLGESR